MRLRKAAEQLRQLRPLHSTDTQMNNPQSGSGPAARNGRIRRSLLMRSSVRASARMCERTCVCMCACVRACVHTHARICVRAHACAHLRSARGLSSACTVCCDGPMPLERRQITPSAKPYLTATDGLRLSKTVCTGGVATCAEPYRVLAAVLPDGSKPKQVRATRHFRSFARSLMFCRPSFRGKL